MWALVTHVGLGDPCAAGLARRVHVGLLTQARSTHALTCSQMMMTICSWTGLPTPGPLRWHVMGLSTVHCHRSIETLTAAMTPEMKPEPLRPRLGLGLGLGLANPNPQP